MPYRKELLVEGETYHICTKSISGFKIFNTDKEFQRMLDTMVFYTMAKTPCKFSSFLTTSKPASELGSDAGLEVDEKIVKIIAYCLMPTHIHLILKQLKEEGISRYMNLILKSYSRYFNIRHRRKGPLWEARFRGITVNTDEQLLHLTRYIHLNPVTAYLVNKSEEWKFSSYCEYIGLIDKDKKTCDFSDCLDINVLLYRSFVDDQVAYQRELARIKDLTLE